MAGVETVYRNKLGLAESIVFEMLNSMCFPEAHAATIASS
jgi:hypothetical protein